MRRGDKVRMRGRIVAGVVAVVAAVVVVPGAVAATPGEIYKDLADNGRLDGTYTRAELEAYVRSATVQGYGNPVVVVPPVVTGGAGVAGEQSPPSAPVAQVAGEQSPPPARLDETAEVQTLPFTGSELALFVLVGGALLAGGFVLRASARQR